MFNFYRRTFEVIFVVVFSSSLSLDRFWFSSFSFKPTSRVLLQQVGCALRSQSGFSGDFFLTAAEFVWGGHLLPFGMSY